MHVDLDAFFVEVCRHRHPELREVDLLVVGGRRDQRGVVQSASYGARKFGIHAGMPIAQAVRLCPAATFFQGSFEHYREASAQIERVLGDFSPTVVMASLDEAYLDFGGTEQLYPGSLLPVGFNLTGYRLIVSDPLFWTNYRNTVLYTVLATAISMLPSPSSSKPNADSARTAAVAAPRRCHDWRTQ